MGGSGGGGGYPTGGAGSKIGGGSAGGSGGGSGGEEDQCVLSFTTDIFGPVPNVASQLTSGDSLSVQLTSGSNPSVGLFSPRLANQQVGSISGVRQLPTLIACLQQGVVYEATVALVSGAQIRIQVRNV